MTLEITEPRIEEHPGGMRRLSARLGSELLWFDVPADRDIDWRGEPFIIAGLLPAMVTGKTLVGHPDLPICPVLRTRLDELQAIFRQWGAHMRLNLRPVNIETPLAPAPAGRGPGSFFSGGVDGTYTWLEAPEPISQVAFVRGIDFQLDNPVYDQSFARNAAWLAERSAALIPVSTNMRWVGRAFGLGWNAYFGAGLSALAHLLGFSTTYVAAGHTWSELWPDGSHPLSDPLWSSATRTIHHHGRGAMRWQKLERIAQETGALEILRVCWQDRGFNCGKCEKCLRTMVLLKILDLHSPNFPELHDLRTITKLVPNDRSEAIFVIEALVLAEQRGNEPVARALKGSLQRWELRRIARMIREGIPGFARYGRR